MSDLHFADDKAASRFTLHRGDDLVSVLDYRDDGRTIALTRAFTVPTFRGHGYAAVVTERAVDAIEADGGARSSRCAGMWASGSSPTRARRPAAPASHDLTRGPADSS